MKKHFLTLFVPFSISLFFAACSGDNATAIIIDNAEGGNESEVITNTADARESETAQKLEESPVSVDGSSEETSDAVVPATDVPGSADMAAFDSYKDDAGFSPSVIAITDSYDGETALTSTPSEVDAGRVKSGSEGNGSNERTSGLLTASEWNDLDNWDFWTNLLNNNNFYDKPDYWKFFPKNLVAVKVVDADSHAIANVTVELFKGEEVEFATKTDNSGHAYCWINLFNGEDNDLKAEDFSLKVNGTLSEEPLKLTTKSDEKININVIVNKDAKHPGPTADVVFIVDATGSMDDEINFLKSDLDYIIESVSLSSVTSWHTAAVFYRDEGDKYLTRHQDFSDNVFATQEFIAEQDADGGGDYPEAVHSALEEALQNISWNESARARIAFLILDAPAHHQTDVIESLQKSITLFAKNGIKIIPVAASGVDKDTEFMLRFFDLATGGTYVFLTDDSGIGNSHIEASVGDHEVEPLADLMVKLIRKYID